MRLEHKILLLMCHREIAHIDTLLSEHTHHHVTLQTTEKSYEQRRATKSNDIYQQDNPIGDQNGWFIEEVAKKVNKLIVA